MRQFESVLLCYESGQMTEVQWQEHLSDELFCAWLKKRGMQYLTVKWSS